MYIYIYTRYHMHKHIKYHTPFDQRQFQNGTLASQGVRGVRGAKITASKRPSIFQQALPTKTKVVK